MREEITKALSNFYRNIAYCIHWAMYRREMSEAELVARSGVKAEIVRALLLAEECDCSLAAISDICFALDMRPTISLEAIEPKALTPGPRE